MARSGIKDPRGKGMRVERMIVNMHKNAGIVASKVPLSGQVGGEDSGDVRVGPINRRLLSEVKTRGKGQHFVMITAWLGDNDLLFCKADHKPPLVIMPWKIYLKLVKAWLKMEDPNHNV